MSGSPAISWLSTRAISLQVGPALAASAARAVRAARLPHVIDVACTLDTVTTVCVHGLDDAQSHQVTREVQCVLADLTPDAVPGREHVIPVCYDAECGPDLSAVAAACNMTTEQVIGLHTQSTYRAGFVGFSPGFAYLQGLDERLHLPRLATPRARVPPGSVAIAGPQTAVYPNATPGGWHLLGRTPLRLFDPTRGRPALIEAGDTIRFTPVSRERFITLEHEQSTRPPTPTHEPALRVLHPGTFSTVQAGSPGLRHAGVPYGGPADRLSAAIANRLVGNADTAPLLEATHSGPILRAQRDVTLAVCGADAAVVVEQASGRLVELAPLTPVSLQPGETLRLHGYRTGARVYIAFSGGLHAASHPLRAGDSLATLSAPRVTPRCSTPALARFHQDCISTRILRVTLHPHAQMLPSIASRLHDSLWRVTPRADRAGIRLEGPPLTHTITTMPSHATLPGDIELTPDGTTIVLGPDAPVTGGYPVLASIIDADQSAMMQCRAGEWVRFAVVTHTEARAAWRDQQSTLNSLMGHDA